MIGLVTGVWFFIRVSDTHGYLSVRNRVEFGDERGLVRPDVAGRMWSVEEFGLDYHDVNENRI